MFTVKAVNSETNVGWTTDCRFVLFSDCLGNLVCYAVKTLGSFKLNSLYRAVDPYKSFSHYLSADGSVQVCIFLCNLCALRLTTFIWEFLIRSRQKDCEGCGNDAQTHCLYGGLFVSSSELFQCLCKPKILHKCECICFRWPIPV